MPDILLAIYRAIRFHSTVNRQTTSPFSGPVFICLLLALATLAVYFPIRNYGFVDYDDSGYFFENPHVLTGLTGANIKWAFTSGEDANWHPLTWLSLMLDAQVFGTGAAAPHLTNVLLHLANSILLFFLFRRLTGTLWRSAALSMLFAIHPLHVESVAWIAERKDVLSAFFGLIALLCYVRHAANDGSPDGQTAGFRSLAYWLTLFFFACGLMSKPMLVTWPFVMLLLDFWPLGRFNRSSLYRLAIEKIPFFLLSASASVATFIVQQKGGAVPSLAVLPLDARVENAFVSYARYLGKIFWPVNLTVIYPYPGYWPAFIIVLSIVLFAGLCFGAVVMRKKFPWLFTGWFWFAGMLVPVIGLVQVGEQAMADRYAYLPIIGVLIIVVWGAYEIYVRWLPRDAVIIFASFLFLACLVRARNQVTVWKDDESLFGHALTVTKDNYVANLDLGFWYSQTGRVREALNYYHDALRMAPDDPTALYNVGNAFAKLGDWSEAIRDYRHGLQIRPNQPDIMDNLGFALAQNKQLSEAIPYFEAVLKLRPDFADAHNNLGAVYFIQGNYVEAAKQYYAALQNWPENSQFAINLGDTFVRLGQKAAAAECYQRALQIEPDNRRVRAKLQSLGPQPTR